ncbi:hypothetical protein GH975_11275 [Litorivicinus lipolyticus]|uniref:Uncharacterized protein n=1 Tax=Litorivicinus lipolyticus TaxID=418701 RepID=A0A5Q2QCT3_9GAMM|nr:hypothetical protein [Litorivicinus lipolyticus]QGG81113.1 hypothetical protein GH975_11275 [Litorivicinus lipolyticus]
MNAPVRNPLCQRARLSLPSFMQIVAGFARGDSASRLSVEVGVSTKSVNSIYQRLRRRIARERERLNPFAPLSIVARERRVRGRRPQCGETVPRLVGVRRVQHQLVCEWVNADNASQAFRILYGQIPASRSLDCWGYQGLIDLDTGRVRRLCTSPHSVASDPLHPLSLEQLSASIRGRMVASQGWPKTHLYLHLKESEWRHGYLGRDPLPDLLKLLRACPI